MNITVRDCLKLPSLRDAKVVAGHAGLDQYVSYVDVLEYAKVFAMADQLFLNNGLIITAFTSVKDDVEAQCNAIRRLHEVGEVGIILYYVGIYLPRVDQRLIDVANELSFPIIVMPENSYALRYNEVTEEIMLKLFEERRKSTRFVPNILRQISMMRERQRNIGGILRLLSDQCHYSFLLLDQDGRECGMATWPMTIDNGLLNTIYEVVENRTDFPQSLSWKDCEYMVFKNNIRTQLQENFHLFTIANAEAVEENNLLQAAEVLQSSYDIWSNDLRRPVLDDLVRMVLNEQNGDIYRVANALHFELQPIRIMWVISPLPSAKATYTSSEGSKIKYMIKEYLQDSRKTCIVDTFDNSVVAFMNEATHLEFDKDLGEGFVDLLQKNYPHMVLLWCGGLDSVQDARLIYILFEEHFNTVCSIYPRKKVFTQRDLSFACSCYDAVHGDSATRDRLLSVLKPLQGRRDTHDMLETLAVYLIDTDKNTAKTAKILHLHESTVKYRLNKIKQELGYDVSEMPGTYNLYQALAMTRLIADEYSGIL